MAKPTQPDLPGLEDAGARLPDGVRYVSNLLSPADECKAAAVIAALDLHPFAFRGYLGNRRTASFGWHYDFQGGGLATAAALPSALLPYRALVAEFAGLEADNLEHCLAIEYAPGAGIGWHRDRPEFGLVAALSFLAPCRMRFRRKAGEGWERTAQILEPRSAYVLDGPGRTDWEHSIPAVDALRYSLTFRTLNGSAAASSMRSKR